MKVYIVFLIVDEGHFIEKMVYVFDDNDKAEKYLDQSKKRGRIIPMEVH